MNGDLEQYKALDLFKVVKSKSDSSFREKPYARLKEEYKVDSSNVDAETYLIKSCEERGVWPIELLLEQFSEKELISVIDYITDCGDRAKFDPPRKLSELRTEKCAYFAGVAAGDGGFNGPNTWSVVDGGREHELEDSRKFIEKIGRLMQDIFGLRQESIWINKRGNRVELKLTNKWFARYIRHVFGLPKSYKKGKLSRPEIFNSEENIAAFWRGVFDTDGHISKDSYRISLSSATRSFLEECREDLEVQDICVREIRKPRSYLLRLEPDSFDTFCEHVGFSHPRKRKEMTEKLREGSRNYDYRGRDQLYIGKFYDISQIDNLRVKGLGSEIKKIRARKDLYQRELAEELSVSRTQICTWESDDYAAPLVKLIELFGGKKKTLEIIQKNDVVFKVGVRGNKNSEMNIPLEPESEIDEMASKVICTGDELRIRNKSEKVASDIEEKFGADVERKQYKFCVRNWTLTRFFSKFYRYEPKFRSYNEKEIEAIRTAYRI